MVQTLSISIILVVTISRTFEFTDATPGLGSQAHQVAIQLSRVLNLVNSNNLLAERDIAQTNSASPKASFALLESSNSGFCKFQDSFLTQLHDEILSHVKQEASGLAPRPVEGITVHDGEVLEPDPIQQAGLVRNDTCDKVAAFQVERKHRRWSLLPSSNSYAAFEPKQSLRSCPCCIEPSLMDFVWLAFQRSRQIYTVAALIEVMKHQLQTLADKRRVPGGRSRGTCAVRRGNVALEDVEKLLKMLDIQYPLLGAVLSARELGFNQWDSE
ncbi:hypothetical protein BDR03DRAFT_984225 [Suillus americanus]|nr:hypothetical protein BDR03DRAFT_984225 [Suillus americanus]